MLETILSLVKSGHSISIYAPGTWDCQFRGTREGYLAVVCIPIKHQCEIRRSVSHHGRSPEVALGQALNLVLGEERFVDKGEL